MNRLHDYISGVLSGEIVTGKLARLAVERHVADLERKRFPYHFDEKEAERAVKFAELCRHWKGDKAGQRITLESHQVFRRSMLYGWRDKNNRRRFTTSYYEVARKNAKTTEAAIDALFHLLSEERHGAQVFAGATKEAQARIVVNDIGQIIKRTPELEKIFQVFYHRDQITRVVMMERGSFVAPLGRDSRTEDGTDPSMGIIDEYHAHRTDEILNIIESGMAARQSPLMNIITTAGFNRESPCYRLRKVATEILSRKVVNERFLVMIHAMDEDDDWKDPKMWVKANPNIGASVNLPYLVDRHKKAMTEGGEKQVDFVTKNLNRWMDAPSVWLPDEAWQACEGEVDIPDGSEVYCGLDLAKSVDLNAFSMWFPVQKYLKTVVWVPREKLQQQQEADYRRWGDEGWVRVVEGAIMDHDVVARDILDLVGRYVVKGMAFDRWIAYHTVIKRLQDEGLTLLEHGQGFKDMHTPTLRFEELVLSGGMAHEGSPVMRWMVGNVVIDRDPAGNIKPTKGKSSGKIDGVVSGIMAIGAEVYEKQSDRVRSVYDGDGVTTGGGGSVYDGDLGDILNE